MFRTFSTAPENPGGVTASGAATSAPHHQEKERLLHRIGGVIRRNPIKSIYAAGLAASITYHMTKPEPAKCTKPKVLVVPFHRLRVVEKQDKGFRAVLGKRFQDTDNDAGEHPIEIEMQELVDAIHHAASDPTIVGLYGIFGHGFGFKSGGWGHVEELRNALRVFRESHRVHLSPNVDHKAASAASDQADKEMPTKPMYAYADTFANPVGSGTPEYYLASMFTHIQLQPQGDLNLFGLHSSNMFLKGFLQKYGIDVHVYKHGVYKNFANMFTDSKYTREHRQNVQGIMQELNLHVCEGIYNSRKLYQYDFGNFWHMVHKAGSFPGNVAQQVGFVDYLPNLDPLDDLVASNQSDEKKGAFKEKLGVTADVDSFRAEKKISIVDYANEIKEDRKKEEAKWEKYHSLRKNAQENPTLAAFMSAVGYSAPFFNIPKDDFSEAKAADEKIAVMKITGGITDLTARKVEKALRKLKKKKDVKCLILRVDSPGGSVTACETIHQELQDLPQKVVVSFGNVSASGGYYISANADRIYALPTTITGSIGVFMVKLGLEGLAKRYGITFDAVTTSELSGSFDPFHPVNKLMKANFQNYTDRAYLHFKRLVGKGRGMDLDDVEDVAKGRVWTGSQAKELGLVDELGGLQRAIAYAQRTHTETGEATVISWPPALTFWQQLEKRRNPHGEDDADSIGIKELWSAFILSMTGRVSTSSSTSAGLSGILKGDSFAFGGRSLPSTMSGVMLTMDENTAIRCLLEQNQIEDDILSNFPSDFFQ